MSDPTIICVLGMHRSGTSLVAQVLHALGLDLGREEHLMRPSPANPTGHWENEPITELNDALLERLGGTWDKPPELAADWEESRELDDLRRRARELIQSEFAGSERFGFKDPRVSLTLPFWQRLLPPMRYVMCLRNPVDVGFSLAARKEEPLPFEEGVGLWLRYVRATLAATATHPLHLIFYEDMMLDSEPEVRRLAGFVGIDGKEAGEADIRAAIRVARSEGLWHHRTPVPNVVDEPRLPFHVKSLYLALRLFARGAEPVGVDALDLLGTYAAESERSLADLEQRLSLRRADLRRLAQERAQEHRRHVERDDRARSVHAQLRAELTVARAELTSAREELERLQEILAKAPTDAKDALGPGAGKRAYDELVDEVRARAQELIPSGDIVLVVSKGDDELLELTDREGWHFPLAPDGRYAGHHPSGDTAVIAQLEGMRARGAGHLLLPATARWWLDHYHGFRRHLEDRYTVLLDDEHCVIYRLRAEDRQSESEPLAALKRAVVALRTGSGHEPAVLDWRTDLGIAGHFPETPVFAPPGEGDELPYLDRSVEIVVLVSANERRIAEARRVAASAIVRVDPSFRNVAEIQWVSADSSRWGENVNLILLPDRDDPAWEPTLDAFAETLNEGFAGHVRVVGAPATLERASAQIGQAHSDVRFIEVAAEAGFAKRAGAAIEGAEDRVQVFVTAPAVPLPGWLPSILTLFSRNPDAGVIGTRILSRFGALEEAGGVLAADGSRRCRGEGDEDPDRPEYSFVRRVDFCSPPLVATRTEVFKRLGGFRDNGVTPGEAVVDFSIRSSQTGAPVYYQPQARMVRIA